VTHRCIITARLHRMFTS